MEGEKAIANGFTIEGLIAAAPLRKTELSRRTGRRRPSGVGAIIFMYAGSTTRRRETAVKRNFALRPPCFLFCTAAIKIPRSLFPLLGIISFH